MIKKIITYFSPFHWFIIIGMIITNMLVGGCGNILSTICSTAGVICVILVAKGKISNYFFGVINVGLYIFISWQAKLYGEVMLNALYYFPIQFIGYYLWNKKIDNTKTVLARTMTKKQLKATIVVCIIGVMVYAQLLVYLGGNTPYLDSASTVLSIIAQILMLACFAEQWLLWIVVDIVSVIMWATYAIQTGDANAWSITCMWLMYLLNAIYGYIFWKNQSRLGDNNV
ncbi:MAG: nicotinamide riboside transporter PnuC [Rikenellaceae bacterium]